MTYPNLNNDSSSIITGNDSIVIVDNFQSIRGGKTLDCTGFLPEAIKAGHVIIQMTTAPYDYKPMPLNGGNTAYAALPASHKYAGILIASILTKKPFAGILIRGTVNPVACPFDMTGIQSAVSTALPLVDFRAD